MLIMFCVLSITLLLKTSSDPVYVDDLAELVDDKTDIWDLEELENNNNVARTAGKYKKVAVPHESFRHTFEKRARRRVEIEREKEWWQDKCSVVRNVNMCMTFK
ncbi:unnamed protein product [Haemonchus placei]|uniref:Secreted protein n=1 Tax=Haemonchus placei TaxID=6290 RepID=A0A158QQV4_HAEPC|nr:unnamed protein product [Haemonchus placei]